MAQYLNVNKAEASSIPYPKVVKLSGDGRYHVFTKEDMQSEWAELFTTQLDLFEQEYPADYRGQHE